MAVKRTHFLFKYNLFQIIVNEKEVVKNILTPNLEKNIILTTCQ
jgi:hypothetical protein